jgi:hypothetical protein
MGLFNNSDSDKEEKPSRRSSTGATRRGSIFSRSRIGKDPTISAEKAEKEADKALLGARNAVKAARDHMKKLEKEASEE